MLDSVLLNKNEVDSFLFIHDEWSDNCIIDYEKKLINRENIENEYGTYQIIDNKIKINWHNWPGTDEFILFDNKYYHKRIYDKIIKYYSF